MGRKKELLEVADTSIWHQTAPPAPFEEDSGRKNQLLRPEDFEPLSVLARHLTKPVLRLEEAAAGNSQAFSAVFGKERVQRCETELLEEIEDAREEAEMPEGYPSSELLAGLHAHVSRYYDSIGCNRPFKTDDQSPLPNMHGQLAPSGLVAMAILMQENVRHQLASAAQPKGRKRSLPAEVKARKRRKKLDDLMEQEKAEAESD